MKKNKILFIFLVLIISIRTWAVVEIKSYHSNQWNKAWTTGLFDELSSEQYSILDRELDQKDLDSLHCPDYNFATDEEKKDFWLVFFSALARSESGLNEKAKSPRMRGHRSYGLLQIAPDTAEKKCELYLLNEQILDGESNLRCGVTLIDWQLSGAPLKNGKKARPDLENQLFGKKILLWGPLRKNDKLGRKRLYDWFKLHLDQLPFCDL